MGRRLLLAATLASACALLGSCATAGAARSAPPPPPPETPHAAAARIAAKIRKADFEGDRAALAALYEEMAPYTEGELASRARYWRGFAMWRRALNGFNEEVEKTELAEDLNRCIGELEQALAADPEFVDAKIGLASCAVNLAVISEGAERTQGYKRQWDLLNEAQKEAPDNPRLAWVLGAARWYAPPKAGGGQAKAFETYKAGLAAARKETVSDSLDPAWGEPELLMNLAFASLNAAKPNYQAADHYAHAALNLVPNWHYVRDILIPQIQAAREKASAGSSKPQH